MFKSCPTLQIEFLLKLLKYVNIRRCTHIYFVEDESGQERPASLSVTLGFMSYYATIDNIIVIE